MAFKTPGEDIAGDVRGESGTTKLAKLMKLGGFIDLDSRLTVCIAMYSSPELMHRN